MHPDVGPESDLDRCLDAVVGQRQPPLDAAARVAHVWNELLLNRYRAGDNLSEMLRSSQTLRRWCAADLQPFRNALGDSFNLEVDACIDHIAQLLTRRRHRRDDGVFAGGLDFRTRGHFDVVMFCHYIRKAPANATAEPDAPAVSTDPTRRKQHRGLALLRDYIDERRPLWLAENTEDRAEYSADGRGRSPSGLDD